MYGYKYKSIKIGEIKMIYFAAAMYTAMGVVSIAGASMIVTVIALMAVNVSTKNQINK
jgi:hypothetical protein